MTENGEVCAAMFRHIGNRRYHCIICLNRKPDDEHEPFVSEKGYANLMAHLNGKLHKDEWRDYFNSFKAYNPTKAEQKLNVTVIKASAQATLRYNVLNHILQTHQPLNIVERPTFKALVNHDEFQTAKTVRKYLFKLYNLVIEEIAKRLPNKFGIALDGWSDGSSNHMVSFFACCPTSTGCEIILIGMNVLDDITGQDAPNHVNTLRNILLRYNKDLTNVNFLVADNTNLNPCIANLLRVPFVGCASHKLNLALKKYLLDYEGLIEKVNKVMKQLVNSNILSGHLKETQKALNKPILRPIVRNNTRWSSTYSMLTRYVKIEEVLRNDRMVQIHPGLLSVVEFTNCKNLLLILDELEYANKELQNESYTLNDVRILFDNILLQFGSLSPAFNQYLRVNSTNHFENGIVSLLREEEPTHYQKVHLRRFLLNDTSTPQPEQEAQPSVSLRDAVEQDRKKQRLNQSSTSLKYMTMYHVIPTSNCCERINSQGRLEKDYTRMSASNKMFEVRMMLRANKSFWNALTIDKILVRDKVSNPEENALIEAMEELDSVSRMREFIMDAPRDSECPDVSDQDMEFALSVNDETPS
jgi:hypothetical protein